MVDYVFIGDDFTGASDTLATLSLAGWRVRLFMDCPDPAVVDREGLDAVGIATDTRALPPDRIEIRLREFKSALQALAPRLIHYKVCSTFDSAPHVGSIGAAVLTLEQTLAPRATLVLGGQPSLGRYCFAGNLFARGPDGAVYRIDRHPVMSRHPITPMGEADLRTHLAAQGMRDLRLVPAFSAPQRHDSMVGSFRQPTSRLLLDVLDQSDIVAVGKAIKELDDVDLPILFVGSSGVAEAAAGVGARQVTAGELPSVPGPRLVVAGSRSSVTAEQIAAARRYERIPLDATDLDETGCVRVAERCAAGLSVGSNVLVYLRPDTDYGMPSAEISCRLAKLTALILAASPVQAIGVAGGDTSGAVVRQLGFESLSFEGRISSGIAICRGRSTVGTLDGSRLLLKGGQLGSIDLFDRFVGDEDRMR